MTQGVLVGADRNAEQLLPWWWNNFSRNCSLPVAIVDFGISKKYRVWCESRMQIINLKTSISVVPPHQIDSAHLKLWKKQYRGPLWNARSAWFQKPQACLQTPFNKTIWLDLDCEVCAPIDGVMEGLEVGVDLAIGLQDTREGATLVYNSGVMVFRKGAVFLKEWAKRCHHQNSKVMGDQDVLTEILSEGDTSFKILSPYFNWLMYRGLEPGIVIAHWAAGWGKEYIRKYGGINKLCCYK